jgi:hypothetical protein
MESELQQKRITAYKTASQLVKDHYGDLALGEILERISVNQSLSPEKHRDFVNLIGDYIQSFIDGQAYGAKRKIDIVTGRAKPNPRFSDTELTANMAHALEQAKYPYAENHPYFTSEGMTSDHLLQQYKGIGLDIPKDSLTISKPGDGVYSAICPDIDALRVVQIATPISSAILKTYLTRTM